jgi:hypothetical protein
MKEKSMNAISGMHKDGRRFFMVIPTGMSRKEFLQKPDIDFDGETFGEKVRRLETHFKQREKNVSDTIELDSN